MRVLMSAYVCAPGWSSEPGIGWGVAAAVAEHHDVWLLTSSRYREVFEDPVNSIPPRLRVEFVEDRGLTPRVGPYPAYLAWQVSAYRRAQRLHRDVSFDIAQHVTFANSAMPSLLGRLGVPFVWYAGSFAATPWTFFPGMGARAVAGELLRDVAAHTAGRAARRITVGRRTTVISVDAPSSRRVKGRRIVLGGLQPWELARLAAVAPPPASGEPFRVLSIGRLLGWKGFHLGIRAFARFQRAVPHSEYLVVGDGEQRHRLERLAGSLGVASRVRFLGACSRDDTFAALGRCHVVLHPSLHEQVGFAVLEAMAAARPVVCVGAAGPPELVGTTGVVVARSSPRRVVDDLAGALASLHGDEAGRIARGVAAQARAIEHWNWARVARDLDEIYRVAVTG
ncbi:MAG TPA: glycosyltransferase [Acidimicrobiales bacterium]|nr:glycosyltransferase [Acidimicrobiales bacterium]